MTIYKALTIFIPIHSVETTHEFRGMTAKCLLHLRMYETDTNTPVQILVLIERHGSQKKTHILLLVALCSF